MSAAPNELALFGHQPVTVAPDDVVVGILIVGIASFIVAVCVYDIRRIWRERGEKRIDQTAADRRARYRIRYARRHGYPSDGDR